jgi:hypothetical protein
MSDHELRRLLDDLGQTVKFWAALVLVAVMTEGCATRVLILIEANKQKTAEVQTQEEDR